MENSIYHSTVLYNTLAIKIKQVNKDIEIYFVYTWIVFWYNLVREAVGGAASVTGLTKERGLVPMVTYSDLIQFVIMLCAVITLVIYIMRKK